MTRSNDRPAWADILRGELSKNVRLSKGDWVQVRSGGRPMQLLEFDESGDAVCSVGERVFKIPQFLLQPIGEKLVRRGRKPGVSPFRRLSKT